MKTLKFKLYKHKRNRYLKRQINGAGVIYNHCIALHKRYTRLWGKYLNCAQLQKHIARLRKRNPFWQLVGSQAVQDICQRIDRAYKLFFKHHGSASLTPPGKGFRVPGFKKVKKYKSFTLLKLKERQWSCPSCSTEHDRDLNAARNIKSVGASTDSLGDVRQSQTAIAV